MSTAVLSSKYQEFMFGGTVTLYIGQDRKKMEIHKKLLASISPELDKHVNNDMKEGIEGIIHFPDEREGMLALFTEWAYTGGYVIVENTPLPKLMGYSSRLSTGAKGDPWPSLHMHLELYVFSDKFNIPPLKELTMLEFNNEFSPIEPKGEADATGLASVIAYAYDNLPDSDPIPKFLAQFVSWKWELLRGRNEFIQFTSTQPEFMRELLVNLRCSTARPVLV